MRSNYKKLGGYIQQVDVKNKDLEVEKLLGVSITKKFIPSIANIIGTDMSKYKIVRTGQFAYGPVTSRNGEKISVALFLEDDCIISTSYTVFEITDTEQLLPEYLMMWFRRPEFDRYARYMSHGSVREIFGWEEMCDIELPIPSPKKQREIVKEYHTVTDRIKLNEQLNQKLEETAQAIYRHWFVDFEFPDENGNPYKSSGGEMEWCEELEQKIPKGWRTKLFGDLCSKIGSGSTPKGGKENYKKSGISLVRSLNVHDYSFIYDNLAFIDENQATKLNNVELHENDVLLNITGVSVARCCMVPKNILPARVNQHVSIIRSKPEVNMQYYLLCALCSTQYKSELLGTSESGSTRQAITKQDIESLTIPEPERSISSRFEHMIKALIDQKNLIGQENKSLFELTDSLLSKIATVKG
jgi:type I restriction enzyme, S subunit